MLDQKLEIVSSLSDQARTNLDLLKSVEESWQPTDFLPDLTKESWRDDLQKLREGAAALPDALLVILVGTMVTEEALPSYQTSFNRLPGVNDPTGASAEPWAQWSRGWTAEENRHGDLLNRYLYTTGRVDMRAVEVTIQHLIRNGFDPLHDNDPYNGLVYTSLQERATKVSHQKVGQLAKKAGEGVLGQICATIAGDEARHEEGYKRFMARIFEADPSGAVVAFRTMLERNIVMPANLMYDGQNPTLFSAFSLTAQKNGVYTFEDYLQIIDHFIEYWKVKDLKGLTGEAAEAQDKVCEIPRQLGRRIKFMSARANAKSVTPFRWIHGRPV
ncbi:MAG: acyl-ACP desaturase [Planctomycetota bacterium]